MKIYVSHSRAKGYDFKTELYEPLRSSSLNDLHEIILPHETSDNAFPTKELFESGIDLVIAEVSHNKCGQGIELTWADETFKIPVLCFYKKGHKYSGSLHALGIEKFIEYENKTDLIHQIEIAMSDITQ
ncbi:hypothetical protein HN587_04365 [Candidatus Woesearchaeota archaeon]|jgi:hypothetical protein|nr:hypothetical protein [Candidatus Woesearchaeota archaeon]